MSMKIGLVWNPSKVDEDVLRDDVEAAIDAYAMSDDNPASTVECVWFETTPEDPGLGAAEAALDQGCTIVVAAGGDGTVRAVAEALGGSGSRGAELGIVPLGTGNLLARNLDVPLDDIQAAFTRVLTRAAEPLDLGSATLTLQDGSVEHHSFVVMVGFGIDAQMIVETDDELKEKAGWLAYVESLGRAVSSTDVIDFTLSVDSGEPADESAHTLLIANCGMLQGGITLLPDAVPDDGELDLLVLRADGVAAWADTLKNMAWDNGLKRLIMRSDTAQSSDSTEHLRARHVRVTLPTPLVCEVDGDDIPNVSSFEVQIQPSALLVR